MVMRVDKREIEPGMVVDVSRQLVLANYGREVDTDTFAIVRLERQYGTDVHKNYILQHTICWDRNGYSIVYYHHFEAKVRVLNRSR